MKFILVVDRTHLFPGLSPQGFLPLDAVDLDVVDRHGFFAEREYMEGCSHYKQLIPYIALCLGDEVLCYQRQAKHSESRLGGLWTVGFGGHIEPFDRDAPEVAQAGMLHTAALRELEEETGFAVPTSALVERGCINSEAQDVSSVHVGVFFTVGLDSLGLDRDAVAAQVQRQAEPHRVAWRRASELTSGEVAAPEDGQWEDWSRIVLESKALA